MWFSEQRCHSSGSEQSQCDPAAIPVQRVLPAAAVRAVVKFAVRAPVAWQWLPEIVWAIGICRAVILLGVVAVFA